MQKREGYLATRRDEVPRGEDAARSARERLESAAGGLWERGRAAWPDVEIEASAFAAYLGERASADAARDAWLDDARAGDLFLACACSLGVPGAIRAFEAAYLERMSSYLRALRPSPELVAETRQELLVSLFVGSPRRPPTIRQYGGRATLERWVGVAALRTALDILRRQKKRHDRPNGGGTDERRDDEVAAAVAPGRDPELALLGATYKDDFAAAFREAMFSLPPRARALLRFTFIDGLAPAKIGVLYGVHRTTAMRWVEAAQETVLARTRAVLMERLHLSPSDCDGIFVLVRSQIHVTLGSLLRTPVDPPGAVASEPRARGQAPRAADDVPRR